MTHDVRILGPETLTSIPVPSAPAAGVRARYTRALIAEGARAMIANAGVDVGALAVDGSVWPLVLGNARARRNSDVCSPYTWYARYTPAELANRRGMLAGLVARARGLPVEAVLALGGIDRVVYVNNWLTSTNPTHGLPPTSLADVTSLLTRAWPDRAIVFRSLNPSLDRSGFDALRSAGYRFVRSRSVYIVDTRLESFARHRNVPRDFDLLERTPYAVTGDRAELAGFTARMVELYAGVYLHKYVRHNPDYRERFFARTLADAIFEYRGLVRGGRLDAMIAFLETEGVLWTFLLGYDLTVGRKVGLYRALMALVLREARDRKLIANLSSGAAAFKTLRGGRAVDEFDGVYDFHLPARRRLPWRILGAASNRRVLDPSVL